MSVITDLQADVRARLDPDVAWRLRCKHVVVYAMSAAHPTKCPVCDAPFEITEAWTL